MESEGFLIEYMSLIKDLKHFRAQITWIAIICNDSLFLGILV